MAIPAMKMQPLPPGPDRITGLTPLAAPIVMYDGDIADLANLPVEAIDFAHMASSLSKLVRWAGRHRGAGISIAQHSVMGADAIFRETGDALPAGYFLVHDGHEYLFGDHTRPAVRLVDHHFGILFPGMEAGAVARAVEAAKAAIDAVVWRAAGLPSLDTMPIHRRTVADMDERMCVAEANALYGKRTAIPLVRWNLPRVRLTESLDKPWPAGLAEEKFIDRLEKYLGIVVRAAP